MLAMAGPSSGAVVAYSDSMSSATDDIGSSAEPVHSACFTLMPLPQLAATTPVIFAIARTATTVATIPATTSLHGAFAATTDTSTNINMVSSDDAVPSCRGHAHGRGFSCFRSRPASNAASGAEPPKCAAIVLDAAIDAMSSIDVFSLVGLMKRSAERSTSASAPATTKETPSTTSTGNSVSPSSVVARCITPARAYTSVSA